MKKFRFGLDSVLDYRQQVLDGLQGEYAKALERVRQQEARKEAVELQYAQVNQEFRERAAEGISIADAMSYETGLRVLERDIARETKRLEELQQAAEVKRRQVMQAHVDTRILERLKEKKLQNYQKDMQKSEEQFIDELVSATRHMESGLLRT